MKHRYEPALTPAMRSEVENLLSISRERLLMPGRPAANRVGQSGRRRRPRRIWPICEETEKQRLGERKDAKLALRAARISRAHANLDGQQSSWTVQREYRCRFCDGWHLTSLPSAQHV
jgi:hypothetical protein